MISTTAAGIKLRCSPFISVLLPLSLSDVFFSCSLFLSSYIETKTTPQYRSQLASSQSIGELCIRTCICTHSMQWHHPTWRFNFSSLPCANNWIENKEEGDEEKKRKKDIKRSFRVVKILDRIKIHKPSLQNPNYFLYWRFTEIWNENINGNVMVS